MRPTDTAPPHRADLCSEAGFSLIELMVASGLLLIVMTIVTSGLLQMTNSQRTIWNRTEMHAGVRSATELLQQEVGQAGRVALPNTVTLNGPVGVGTATATLTPSAAGIFVNELLVVDTGINQENVQVTAVNAGLNQITIQSVDYNATPVQPSFTIPHAIGAPVRAYGGFTTGIIPPLAAPANYPNGSTGNVLKMYGDINGDGNMVYVEYTCDVNAGKLYRNVMSWTAATKPPLSDSMALLTNITANPNNAPCFSYTTAVQKLQGTYFTFVLDVAITLTVQTNQIDPITRQKQQETKALLNVSPRNIFNAWALAATGYTDRIQSTPTSITALLYP